MKSKNMRISIKCDEQLEVLQLIYRVMHKQTLKKREIVENSFEETIEALKGHKEVIEVCKDLANPGELALLNKYFN